MVSPAVATRGLPTPRWAWLGMVAVLVAAFGLRLWDVNAPSIWHDEGWSIRAIRDPIGTPDDNTPPLYYALMHGLWLGGGESPLALRYGSVLLDVVTVALAMQLMRRWGGLQAALITGVLLAASPLMWAYAREVRAYVMVPLLALVLLALVDRLLTARGDFPWRVWIALLIAELALLYSHNLSVPVVAWLNLTVGAVLVLRWAWRWLGFWLVGQAALLLAYLPWLLGQSPSGTALNTPPRVDFSLIWDVVQGYFAPLPTMVGAEDPLLVGTAAVGLIFLWCAGAILLVWRRSRFALLVLSQAVLLPVLATVELVAANIDFHPRYYVAGVPAALMVVVIGMMAIKVTGARRISLFVAVCAVMGTGLIGIKALLDDPQYQHDDFRAIAEYYATLPDETLIVIPYGWEPALDVYYADKLDIRAEMLGIDLHSDLDTVSTAINAALAEREGPVQVELLNWFQLPADLRGMYPCLLAAAGEQTGERVVQGIVTTGYRIAQPITLAALDAPAAVNDGGALTVAAVMGEAALCVQTDWQFGGALDTDWRVSVRVLTTEPAGWVIARSESDIRNAEQEPTSAFEGGTASAFNLLRLPDGTPPGDYTVRLVVFSERNPSGLDWVVDGVPAGRFVRLATLDLAGNTTHEFTDAPPQPLALAVTDGIMLVGLDAGNAVLTAGQELRITLYWTVDNCCTDTPWTAGTLTLQGEDWSETQPVTVYGPYSRDWHALRVPAGAHGAAQLMLETSDEEPVILAEFTVEQTEYLFAPPAFAVPVDTAFGDLAVLEGFSVAQTTLTTTDTLDLTVVWRALAASETSYRVFTHLLDAEGHVIAQRDDYPLSGERPTTGWVSDEYLVDPYVLGFDPDYSTYSGPARLEIGFYDPDTGQRVLTANGADHIVLPIEITVQ